MARAELVDGWGQPAEVDFPVPKVRVYGEPPTPTPTRTPTPTVTPTPTSTATATATREPQALYLPLLLHLKCGDTERNADVVLVLDASTSMSETTSPGGPTKLQAAKDAARVFMGQLVAGRDQVALVQFNSEATVLVDLTDQPTVAIAGLDRISQASGTAINKALTAGAAVFGGPGRRVSNNAVLILLTDGEPTGTTREEVLAAAGQAQAAALVFTIGLGQAVDQELLRAIASRSNGFFYAPDTSQLALIYSQIAYEIPCRPGWP
ncbi:MAG TPA: VWA domain-containing protein [Anaerolineae bacterium]|nr:VWA domain-containing protein [Anaerolineae bacterium]